MAMGNSDLFHSDSQREYYRCHSCLLTFVPPSQLPSPDAEKAEYDKHRNSPEDQGYRKFLSRLFIPLQARLKPKSNGLDFGSGPGPTLSVMFEEEGHRVNLFDPCYAPDRSVLEGHYDFVTATEVVEHFHDPAADFSLLWSLVKPGGWLGLMTQMALDQSAFSRWHYKNDPTHVCFFSLQTMSWLANQWQSDLLQVGSDVFLYRKTLSENTSQLSVILKR